MYIWYNTRGIFVFVHHLYLWNNIHKDWSPCLKIECWMFYVYLYKLQCRGYILIQGSSSISQLSVRHLPDAKLYMAKLQEDRNSFGDNIVFVSNRCTRYSCSAFRPKILYFSVQLSGLWGGQGSLYWSISSNNVQWIGMVNVTLHYYFSDDDFENIFSKLQSFLFLSRSHNQSGTKASGKADNL